MKNKKIYDGTALSEKILTRAIFIMLIILALLIVCSALCAK